MIDETLFWGIVGPLGAAVLAMAGYIVRQHKQHSRADRDVLKKLIHLIESDTKVKEQLASSIEIIGTNVEKLNLRLDAIEPQLHELYAWHDVDDPANPGGKIWWNVGIRDGLHSIESAIRGLIKAQKKKGSS